MNRRVLLSGFLVAVCLATLWGVWSQRSQVAGLRAEQQQLMALVAPRPEDPASPGKAEASVAGSEDRAPGLVATPELLRLRSEVTRLTERRRELAGVRAANERLRTQLVSRGTNGSGGFQLPPGYVRKRDARMVGYNTPEDTLQSLLWAIQNRDLTNVLQAFMPQRAEELRARAGESREESKAFFTEAQGLVGMGIVKREPDARDGSVAVEVEVLPGEDRPRITFQQTNGQWKIAGPF